MGILYGVNFIMPQQKYELRRYIISQSNEIKIHRLFLCNQTAVNLYTAVKLYFNGGLLL